jgi:hypothetical protein
MGSDRDRTLLKSGPDPDAFEGLERQGEGEFVRGNLVTPVRTLTF